MLHQRAPSGVLVQVASRPCMEQMMHTLQVERHSGASHMAWVARKLLDELLWAFRTLQSLGCPASS
jgi:hypothetical protein